MERFFRLLEPRPYATVPEVEVPEVELSELEQPVLKKPEEILNRDKEWSILSDMWRRDRPELVFVVGQRRVGKSFVLSRFAREVSGIYYQATKSTEREQIAALSRILGDRFEEASLQAGLVLPSWEAIFQLVTRHLRDEPLLFVIDEFTYLVDAAPALPSIIQKFWDHDWQNSRLKLVLSGSYVSAMTRLESGDQPLFGRRTAKSIFSPFRAQDAAHFTPKYLPREKLIAYGTFGHLPGNLALQNPARTLRDNISREILSASGRLSDDAQHLLDAFLGESSVYYAVLVAIAGGDHTWRGITSRVGRSGGSLARPLQWLEEMGLVERIVPITERNPDRSKRAQYRVADPYVRFWQRIVAPLVNLGMLGLAEPGRLWTEWVEPRLDEYMGLTFEGVCRDYVRYEHALPFESLRVGEWWDASSKNQVDVVALGGRGELFLGECKWGGITASDLDLLRQRASMVTAELEQQPLRVHLALFSASGKFDRHVKEEASRGDVLLFTADDLFAGEAR